jgi:hypothetical protein
MRLALTSFSIVLLWSALASAQPAEPKSDLAANAALQYWKAFALMPTLDKDQEKLLKDWNTVPLDAAAQKLIAASQASMTCLRRASKMDRCDWGLDYDDGIGMLLPHLGKARDLARLAALRTRSEFEKGDKKAARDDAIAMMALARNAGRDPVMIGMLVRFAIEGLVVDVVAPNIPDLKASYEQSRTLFASLPAAPSLQDACAAEKKFFTGWMLRKIKEEEQRKKGAGMAFWNNAITGTDLPDAVKKITTLDEVTKLLEACLGTYDELAKLVALPRAEFDAQYPAFLRKTTEANPIAGMVLPAVEKVLTKEQRNQARFEMLLAGIAVAESGPDKLKEIRDPFGDGPFEYKALDKGFELKSKLLFEGKPVTLTIGKGKAE